MNRILFSIGPDMQGQVQADLQVALRFLIDEGFFGFNQDEREVTFGFLLQLNLPEVRT